MIDLFQPPEILLPSSTRWLWQTARALVPRELEDVITWTDRYYRVVNKDRDTFNTAESPWLIEPLHMADDPLISEIDYVKPIQVGGGTSLGEIMLLRWILSGTGLIQYNWPTNEKAKDRWEKFTEKRLLACQPLRAILPREYENLFIKFPGITFAMQGVFTSGNLDSDTVDAMINEEVHQWEPGMLGKARGRQTRVDFPKLINISNAGIKGDQLHQNFNEGTQQHFMVKCPGCSNPHHTANTVYHTMRTRWEESQPQLGGLRYDTEGCKRTDGTFDYNKLIPTIRFQFPCGYPMRDDIAQRRTAATSGKYSDPYNTGALLSHRSYTFQAVACHTKRWLDLIQRKHLALRMLKTGDDTEWRLYLQEDECLFYDPDEHRPFQGEIVTTVLAAAQRKGLPNEAAKIWAADWQQGYKHLGELTHYWLVIESVDAECNSQVIFAGTVDDEQELLRTLADHGITAEDGGGIFDGFIDASKNTKHIQAFCFRHGINCVMGNASVKGTWKWPDGTWRYFAPKKFLYKELDQPPKYDLRPTREGWVEDPAEPFIIMYNKAGLLANHFYLREIKTNILAHNPVAIREDYIERIIPSDIGQDYLKHHEAWARDHTATSQKKMNEVEGFKRLSKKDHLMSCTTYIDLYKDLSGLLATALARLGIERKQQQDTNSTN